MSDSQITPEPADYSPIPEATQPETPQPQAEASQSQVESMQLDVETVKPSQTPRKGFDFSKFVSSLRSKIKKPTKKTVIISTSVVLVLLLIIGGVFLRLGNQSVLARSLDAIGQHRLAYGADYLAQKGPNQPYSSLYSLDLSKPAECEKAWDITKNYKIKDITNNKTLKDFKSTSNSFQYSISPGNPDYKDTFIFDGTLSSTIKDINTIKFSADSVAAVDFDVVKQVLVELGATPDVLAQYDFGQTKLSGNVQTIIKPDNENSSKIYLTVPQLQLQNKKFNETLNLKDWYSDSIPASTTSSLSDISNINLDKVYGYKLKDMFEDNTGKAAFNYLCSGLDSYEVGAPEKITFGTGYNAKTQEVRPVTIKLKKDFTDVYARGGVDIVDAFSKDNKLKEFLKNHYSDFKEVIESSSLSRSSGGSFPTESEFKKSIGDTYKPLTDEEKKMAKQSIEDGLKSFHDTATITTSGIVYYVNMDDLSSYGLKSQATIAPTASTLSRAKLSETVNKLVKDGISLSFTTYDNHIGDKVPNIDIPSSTKSSQELSDAVINSNFYKELIKLYPTSPSVQP